MITLKEIAELAGVSRGTVDRVLKSRPGVSKAVVDRVNAIAEHYGYTPNKQAQALVNRKKEYKIGVISSSSENPFFRDVGEGIRAAEKEVRGLGATLMYREVPKFDPDTQLRIIDEVLAAGVDGLAIRPVNDEAIVGKLKDVRRRGLPIITFNTDLEELDRLAHVGSDFRRIGRLAAGLLSAFCGGRGRVVIPIGSMKSYGPKMVADAFRDEIGRYPGMSVTEVMETLNDDILTYTEVMKYLRSDRFNPETDAFFFASGGKEGGIRALREVGAAGRVKVLAVNTDPFTRECLEEGVVAATICEKPFVQGYDPVVQLVNFVVYGESPAEKIQYTRPEIIIRQSL